MGARWRVSSVLQLSTVSLSTYWVSSLLTDGDGAQEKGPSGMSWGLQEPLALLPWKSDPTCPWGERQNSTANFTPCRVRFLQCTQESMKMTIILLLGDFAGTTSTFSVTTIFEMLWRSLSITVECCKMFEPDSP